MTEELELFLEDADEQLEFMETALVDMQESGVNDEDIGALFRAMHTIKGTAGMFGFDDVVSFTHIAESLLSEVRDEKIALSDDELDLFLKCKDHVEELVRLASQDEMMNNESRLIHGELSSKLKAKMFDSPAVENTKASLDELQNPSTLNDDIKLWQIDIKLLEEFYTSGMDIINIISFLKDLGTLEKVELITSEIPLIQNYQPLSAYIGFHIELSTDSPYEDIEEVFEFILDDLELNIIEKDSKEIVEKPVEVIASKEVYKKQKKESQEHKNFSLRVDSSKVDQLINQISEMVIANAKIAQRADELDDADLSESTLIMTDMLEEVRSSVMNVRMVQVGDSFSKFRRIVNDTAKKIGKSINFTINGGETELDKMVVEKISDPLMHMLRNSVDHGVEMPDEREASGKAKEGVVTLSAYPDAGTIVIEIKDDGKGLDRDKILSKAIAN
ncbi:MAG: Hpt domain-containing protein, partial [Sulfurimonas sp.]|nr:Hpt domain-containing protein [Sulfurimonas sp.]